LLGLDPQGATGNYDAGTRTLTYTQAGLTYLSEPFVCTAFGSVQCATPGVPSMGIESFNLALLFDADLAAFTGTGTRTFSYQNGSSVTTAFSFSGTAVPVPAAAWLFGSGLLGLAGAARKRRN